MVNRSYWSSRYQDSRTGWDIGYPSPPLAEYLDQLEDKSLRILIPGAGNAYEAEYAWRSGFTQVYVLDIAPEPLQAFSRRVPDFPSDQLLEDDFFHHFGAYDLILEQTFFCALNPESRVRSAYARQMAQLLSPGGKLVGLWFDLPQIGKPDEPPHGGTRDEYLGYLKPYFSVQTFAKATNSIKPRAGNELFGIFQKIAR
ncbi:MAG: methyltransferase domain-containing protein [Bacteroidota bacterium]